MGLGELIAVEALVLPRPGPPRIDVKGRGFMVAMMVPAGDVDAVAEAGGWDPAKGKTWSGELHCTLSYVEDPSRFSDVVKVVRDVAKNFTPVELVTTRPGFFLPDDQPTFGGAGPKKELVHYVGVNGPGLEALSSAIRRGLYEAGIESDVKYPVFLPHVTIEVMSGDRQMEIPSVVARAAMKIPQKFIGELAVCDGGKRVDVPWSTERFSPSWMQPSAEFLGEIAEAEVSPGDSALAKHMTRAVYHSLRKRGENEKNAAKDALSITGSNLRKNGFLGSGNRGARLTGKGGKRSGEHASEPEHASKAAEYEVIKKLASK